MSKSKVIPIVLILGALGVVAYFNNSPGRSRASTSELSDYVLYGINSTTGELQRYAFASGTLQTVGTVRDSGDTVLTGIRASAYIPGFVNIYGFWHDPSDNLSKLVYINATDASAAVVGYDLGSDEITGATAIVDGASYRVYALQSPDLVDFTITGGRVIPSEEFATKVTVLGAAITYGSGGYDMPVGMQLKVGSSTYDPFGAFTSPLSSNLNNDNNPRHFVVPSTSPAADQVSITANCWLLNSGQDGDVDSEWTLSTTIDSINDSPLIKVLRNGDPIPDIPGFADQASLVEFIQDYIAPTTGTVTLGANQTIYLFELGTTDPTSSAADFQDLVVLVTLGQDTSTLEDTSVSGVAISGTININPNSSPENEFTLVKSDGTVLTRDDLTDSATIDGDGTLYDGQITSVKLKPKGSGSQNSLLVDGVDFELLNQTTYTVDGSALNARVYNDHVNGSGQANGKWWIELTTATGSIRDGGYDAPAGRLVEVNHQTGETTHVMDLARPYDSLASDDGQNFYAFTGTDLYLINTTNGTETLIGTVASSNVEALEYAGADLYGFDVITDQLAPIDPNTSPLVGTPISLGTMEDLGTVIIAPLLYDPSLYKAQYD